MPKRKQYGRRAGGRRPVRSVAAAVLSLCVAWSALAGGGLVVSGLAVPTMALADDGLDRFARSREIRENEARGGPRVQGANSPFMVRVRVCKDLPTPVRDKKTGKTRMELRERCWFE